MITALQSAQSKRTAMPVPTARETVLELRGVSVDYGSLRVLQDVNLSVGSGELIALLGPSGSGKTTIIRSIAGFIQPSGGEIVLRGNDLAAVAINRRNIGMVFQSYALFPHLSVAENIAYPLRVQKKGRAQIRSRVDELVDLVQLSGHAHKRPSGLSGGQQQRVALARALAMDPELLLLDEPLSNLDANLRREVGEEIRRLQQRTGTTAIMVTHDRQEAFGMADRIAVLRGGRIEQLDTPDAIYRRPATSFMASFVGDANLLSGKVLAVDSNGSVVTTDAGPIRTNDIAAAGAEVTLLVRPEDIQLTPVDDKIGALVATVNETFYYGSSTVVQLTANGVSLQALVTGSLADRVHSGDQVALQMASADVVVVANDVDAAS
ncbi:ABC transporter ATP-binding protein [Arthrobacter wenxiniae]|uniref:ABC-type quaternary amine transporter n=1 Tax=Arthrobacter wenxiniae TaxID=2713570 RepID=A0A7Y7LZ25_9MICC|nr:ABC transporter ATP-binding protein [Arthrobacter wenxiniae]NVM94298.1 ABC transporter ATP-binding protein [Arthrobacter wenxiniae]